MMMARRTLALKRQHLFRKYLVIPSNALRAVLILCHQLALT
jgi:hypothetical protein